MPRNNTMDAPMGMVAANEAPAESLELLPLALARPREALERARALLATDPGPVEASVARQVVGIVLRDFGDVDAAVAELRASVRLARAGHATERLADARATLGIALVQAGRSATDLARADEYHARAHRTRRCELPCGGTYMGRNEPGPGAGVRNPKSGAGGLRLRRSAARSYLFRPRGGPLRRARHARS